MTEDNKTTGALARWAGNGKLPAASKQALAQALAASAEAGTTGGGDTDYLTFSGQGANYKGWTLGKDKKTPDPDALYVLDPMSATEGWTCWKGGKPVEKHSWNVTERATRAVRADSLRDHGPYDDGDGWSFSMGIAMFDVDDPSRRIFFETTATSAKNALGDLTNEIADRLLADDPFVPVVELSSEKFTAKGKINGKPVFKVEGWVTEADVMGFINAGDEGDIDDFLAGKYGEATKEEAPAPTRARRQRQNA